MLCKKEKDKHKNRQWDENKGHVQRKIYPALHSEKPYKPIVEQHAHHAYKKESVFCIVTHFLLTSWKQTRNKLETNIAASDLKNNIQE